MSAQPTSHEKTSDDPHHVPEHIDQEIDALMGVTSKPKKPKKEKKSRRRDPEYWQRQMMETSLQASSFGQILKFVRGVGKVLFFPVVGVGDIQAYNADGDIVSRKRPLPARIIYGLLTRIFLTPLVVISFMLALVYFTTHPKSVQANETPESIGMFYQSLSITNADGQNLHAWYVPTLTAGKIMLEKEDALTKRWPAAVLVHDLGAGDDQLLPLAAELHRRGIAVLMLDLRGQGASAKTAVTFGLRERFDVIAAVRALRAYPNIDGSRIAVVGKGMGANAALHAAALDQGIGAVILDSPWGPLDRRSDQAFTQARLPGPICAVLYRLTFESMMREHVSDLDFSRAAKDVRQPVLMITNAAHDGYGLDDPNMGNYFAGPRTVVDSNGDDAKADKQAQFIAAALNWNEHADPSVTALLEHLKQAQVN